MSSASADMEASERTEAEISPILMEGGGSDGEHHTGSVSRAAVRRGVMAGVGIFAAALVIVCMAARPPRENLNSSNPESSVRLNLVTSILDVAGTLAESIKSTSETMEEVRDNYHNMKGMYSDFKDSGNELLESKDKLLEGISRPLEKRAKFMEALEHMNATERARLKALVLEKLNITSFADLRPRENLHDGNQCEDDEELHAGLCYKKCKLLTGGTHALRTSAWSCCSMGNLSNCAGYTTTNIGLCGGYGVSGDASGNGCPHTPGGCLKDEELWAGSCYKMCSILTYNQLPYRTAPATCCKVKTWLSFLDFENCNTDDEYHRGGGRGDHNASTPAGPHMPLLDITEG